MGSAISTVTNGAGDLLGNAFMAPLKSIFGQSCQGICSGPWDVICFFEHLCVSNILRLLMILVLCYITLLFFYILFKLGLCQCIGKSLCRICWGACEMYWFSLQDITCFLWHKLLSTERVNRRRYRDVERGYGYGHDKAGLSAPRRHTGRFRDRSFRISRASGGGVSVRVKGRSHRRRVRLSKPRNFRRDKWETSKRRRLE